MTAGQHELISDEPKNIGGSDEGPDPYDYLMMSLGSCTVITIRMYAERKGWDFKNIYMELRHQKDYAEDCKDCDDPKAKIDVIEKEIIIEGDLSDDQLERLLEISKKCPVHKTMQGDLELKSTIERK